MDLPDDPKTSGRALPLMPPAEAACATARATRRMGVLRRLKVIGLVLVVLAAAGGAGLGGLLVYYTAVFPDPMASHRGERAPIIRLLARDGTLIGERGAPHDFMPLSLLPDHIIQAVIATEDQRYFEHWGIDPIGMLRAAFANLRAGRFAQGGSTLTQQLAKNLFLTHDRTLSRKLEELALAVWLEVRLTKHDILELYLNRVYFGGGAYGIEAAAQRYFDKSARTLSVGEAAVIAGLLKAPSRYAPSANPRLARSRGRVVLGRRRVAGFLTPWQHARALGERIHFAERASRRQNGGVEYVIDHVLDRMPPLLDAGHAEVVVETTLDLGLQRAAQETVADVLQSDGQRLAASQAAVVVLDTDGAIRAMVGGRSYSRSQFNRAVKAKRQPGSAFKPLVYLAALERGLTPDSIAYDLPVNIEGWSPRNDNGRHRGAVTLREALAGSINTVAARLLADVGAPRVVDTAARLGVASRLNAQPSLALGASEVGLLELTGAYGAFASGGIRVAPHVIRRIRLSSGRVLHARAAPDKRQIISRSHVAAMNDMLATAMAAGTGRRARLAGHVAAGKTGTTQDHRDAWFIGYTAHLVAGVWVGNDDGQPMRKVTGGGLPAEIWRKVMEQSHEGRAPLALPGAGAMGKPRPARPAPVAVLSEADMPTRPRRPAAHERNGQQAYPEERIGADFIALAVDGLDGSPSDGDRQADGGGAPARDVAQAADEPAADGRRRQPLPGLMALGRAAASALGLSAP